jgi:hypothetical protein
MQRRLLCPQYLAHGARAAPQVDRSGHRQEHGCEAAPVRVKRLGELRRPGQTARPRTLLGPEKGPRLRRIRARRFRHWRRVTPFCRPNSRVSAKYRPRSSNLRTEWFRRSWIFPGASRSSSRW